MNLVEHHLKNTSMLFRALDAAKNLRAFGLLISTITLAIIVMGMFGFISAHFASNGSSAVAMIAMVLGFLVAAVVFFTGFSAVGIILMDQAKDNPGRPIPNALFAGLVTIPRFIGLILLEILLGIVFAIALAILLFVCKIPVLGPLLYTLVFPLSALFIGATYFALVFVVNPLTAPALWDGNTVMQTFAKLWQLAKNDLIPVVINQLVLALIVGLVAFILFAIVGIGSSFTMGLSTTILGPEVGASLMGLFGSFSGLMRGGESSGSGYLIAMAFGFGFMMSSAAALPMLVAISGNCLIYLQYARSIDTAEIEEQMRSKMNEIKDKAAAAREQLKQNPESVAQPAFAPSSALVCPSCRNIITLDDVFCGSCGHKLK
jgi:hypothetical protein